MMLNDMLCNTHEVFSLGLPNAEGVGGSTDLKLKGLDRLINFHPISHTVQLITAVADLVLKEIRRETGS